MTYHPDSLRRLGERHQPGDLWIATRWVLRTRSRALHSARQFLDGRIVWPLREERHNGRTWLRDDVSLASAPSRVLEVSAALVALTDAGLDVQVLFALRETPWISDEDAFAALAMGMSSGEALACAQEYSFPDRDTMLSVAALRGVSLYSIYADGPAVA